VTIGALFDDLDLGGNLALLFVLPEYDCLWRVQDHVIHPILLFLTWDALGILGEYFDINVVNNYDLIIQ
jgi:hypothetical protein